MSMLRLAERVMGEGDLYRLGERVLRAGYEMSLYHEYTVQGGDLKPTGDVIEGQLHAPPDALEPLLGTSSPLTLHLDDGRSCDVYVLNTEGQVTAADLRGFYR